MGEAETVPGAHQHPSGSGLLQMSLDLDVKSVTQEAGAQCLGVERGGCQRVHAVLREPGQAPLDDVPDRVGNRRGQPRRTRHAANSGQAGQFRDEQRVARGPVPQDRKSVV